MLGLLTLLKRNFILSICSMGIFIPASYADGGISIQGTRIIYPQDASQHSVIVRNSSAEKAFLVQSWVEGEKGNKTSDFIITPPLYLSKPGSENILRLIFSGVGLPVDRESLYYFIAKAIPPIVKKNESNAVFNIAAASRIKLFVRPKGIPVPSADTYASLTFQRQGTKLKITNPSPYYITLTSIKVEGVPIDGVMVAPKSTFTTELSGQSVKTITFSVINDYGAVTKPVMAIIN